MVQELGEGARPGYDQDFLGVMIAAPEPGERILADILVWGSQTVLPYTHFSLVMSVSQRFAYWVAWNIDGGALKKLSRANLGFSRDPRIPAAAQVGNELYAGNRLDRGHLARRADLTWGSLGEAQQANADSFSYTNIAPQMDDFNQSRQQGLWGRLEDALYEDVEVDDLRVSVMAGPVFHDDDQMYRNVRLPREYWKVLAYCCGGALRVRAFLLTQDLDPLQAVMAVDEFRLYQVELAELEERTGLIFPAVMHAGTTRPAALATAGERKPLSEAANIHW